MTVTVGSLLQYKEEYYGRKYRSLPKIPFDNYYEFLPTINSNVFSYPVAVLQSGVTPSPRETARKKYVLFCSQVVRVHHPAAPVIGCNYIKCFVSDPYTNDATDGWMREDWVEPLNELGTYFEENAIKARKILQEIGNREQRVNSQDFQDIILRMRKAKFE